MPQPQENSSFIRNDWKNPGFKALYRLPRNDLLFQTQAIHRQNFNLNEVSLSSLMNIKSGVDFKSRTDCPQSRHHTTGLSKEQWVVLEDIICSAKWNDRPPKNSPDRSGSRSGQKQLYTSVVS